MRALSGFFLLLFLLLVPAPLVFGARGPQSRAGVSSDERQVRAALEKFLRAFNDLDWDSFRGSFAADASVFHPDIAQAEDLGRVDGRKRIEASFRSVFDAARRESAGPPYLHIVARNLRIQMLPGAAIVTFEFDRPGDSFGRRTFVFRKLAEGWRIVHVHASNVARRPGGH